MRKVSLTHRLSNYTGSSQPLPECDDANDGEADEQGRRATAGQCAARTDKEARANDAGQSHHAEVACFEPTLNSAVGVNGPKIGPVRGVAGRGPGLRDYAFQHRHGYGHKDWPFRCGLKSGRKNESTEKDAFLLGRGCRQIKGPDLNSFCTMPCANCRAPRLNQTPEMLTWWLDGVIA